MLLLVVLAVRLLYTEFAMAAALPTLSYGQPCSSSSSAPMTCQPQYLCDRHLRRCDCPPDKFANISLSCQDRIHPGNRCDPSLGDLVRQCVPNAYCNSHSRNCTCYPEYYYNNTTKTCMTPLLKVGSTCNANIDCEYPAICINSSCNCTGDLYDYNGKCSHRISPHSACSSHVNNTKQCVDNASCKKFLTAYICLCERDTFSNGAQCSRVVGANESCNYRITEPQQCTDNSRCDRHSNRCLCEPGYFQKNAICSPTISAGQQCNASLHDPTGLQCTTNSNCTLDSSSSTATCTCHDDYYIKQGTCYRKLAPTQKCTSRDTCVGNATCHAGICTCNSDWFFDPFKGNCQKVLNVGDPCNLKIADPHQCPSNSHCGSFGSNCTCDEGYFHNGAICERVHNAGVSCNPILGKVCVPFADCKNDSKQNTYICSCQNTYYKNNGDCSSRIRPMVTCNAAIQDPKQCVDNATCDANLHVCTCINGLVANLATGVCEDMSQVQCNSQAGSATLFDGCPAHAHCVNGKCECEDGYERNIQSQHCEPTIRPIKAGVDCNHPNDICVTNATCTRVDSFAFCQCNNRSYNRFGECVERVRNYDVCYTSIPDPLQCIDGAHCTNGHCECLASHYVDYQSNLCYPRISAGGSCNSSLKSDQCVSYANCTHNVCVCNDGFYNQSGNCYKQFPLGTICDPNIHGQCGGYNMAACDAITLLCACGAGFYNSNGVCQQRGHLGDPCNPQLHDADQCMRHGYCNSSSRCDCAAGYFDNSGFCSERVQLGEPCNQAISNIMQCLDVNAFCNGTRPVCTCNTGYKQQINHADCTAIVH